MNRGDLPPASPSGVRVRVCVVAAPRAGHVPLVLGHAQVPHRGRGLRPRPSLPLLPAPRLSGRYGLVIYLVFRPDLGYGPFHLSAMPRPRAVASTCVLDCNVYRSSLLRGYLVNCRIDHSGMFAPSRLPPLRMPKTALSTR